MTQRTCRTRHCSLGRIFAALVIIALVLPLRVFTPSAPSSQAASTCLGWTTGGNTYTTRRIQYTSDGVLHLVGCNEAFTLTDILNAANANTIVGSEPANFLQLVDSGQKIWMLNVNLTVEEGATLNLVGGSGGDVNWLRLKSGTAGIIWVQARNSTLVIQNSRVSSWDPTTGTFDYTTPGAPGGDETGGGGTKPRSFIYALSFLAPGRAWNAPTSCSSGGGGRDYYEARMDIINSQVDHLGYHGAQAYGASWKVYSTDASLLPPNSRELYNRADVFGVIQNSTITQNYFGAYTFGSYCMNVTGNHFDNNYWYGFDPHDDSDSMTVTNNSFNGNGGHGFICSVYCDHLVVQNNQANNNGRNGMMIHRRVDGAVIENNTASSNGDSGLAVFDSYNATVRSNRFEGNGNAAIRLSVGSSNNLFEDNTLTGGSGGSGNYVVYTFTGSDTPSEGGSTNLQNNTFRGNTITGSSSPLFRMQNAIGTLIEANAISAGSTLTTYEFTNGTNNTIRANTVSATSTASTIRSGTTTDPITIIADPQLNQAIVIKNSPSGSSTTRVTDSRSYAVNGLTMTAASTGTSGSTSSSSVTITPRELAVKPATSTIAVSVGTWQTSSPFSKSWTEAASGSPGAVSHTVGNLQSNSCYEVKAGSTVVGKFMATGSGSSAQIAFSYSGNYPTGSALSFTVGQVSGTCSGPTPNPVLTLSKTKSKFNGWVVATMTGFSAGSSVTLRWSDGTVLTSTTSDGSGNATASFRTPLVPYGDYTVTAKDSDGNSADAPLRVIPRIMLAPDDSGPVGFRFRVYLYGFSPGNQVQVRWYDANGATYHTLGTLTIADNGRASKIFYVPSYGTTGPHLIRAKVIGISRSVSTTFTVTGPAASDEGTPTPTASATLPAEGSPVPDASPSETITPEATPSETPAAPSPVAFSEDFESGLLTGWPETEGFAVQQSEAYSGSHGGQANGNESGSFARRPLSEPQTDLYYRVRFKVDSLDSIAYLLRFRTADNDTILGIALTDQGMLGMYNRATDTSTVSEIAVFDGNWHEVQVHINVRTGAVEVWYDTRLVPEFSVFQPLGPSPIGAVELGDTSTSHRFSIVYDDVAVDTAFIPTTFQPPVEPTATPTEVPTTAPEPSATPAPTDIPAPTETPVPTEVPTKTPVPTVPAAEATP